MATDQGQRVPRLNTWLHVALVAAGLILFMIALPSGETREDRLISDWLQKTAPSQKKNIRVVILGTSLTGCGLDSTELIERKLQSTTGKKADLLKIWKLNASPETFAGLSKPIFMAQPDIVVVESNILFYSFTKNKGWTQYVQRFRDFTFRRNERYQPDDKPVIVRRAVTELERFRSGLIDTSQLADFRSMLERLADSGSTVLLLNFPLESSLELRKWTSADTAVYGRNIRYLSRKAALISERKTELWGGEYFIDYAHMNKKGRQRQTDCFCKIIEAQLNR